MNLIFIHGFAASPAIWEFQRREFSSQYMIYTAPRAIETLESAVVVGWSMGGWKAMELYRDFPHKINGLVLVSAFAKYLKSEDYPFGISPVLLNKLEKRIRNDYKDGLRYFYSLVSKNKGLDHLFETLPVPEKKDIDRWFEKLRQEDMRTLLPRIMTPVMLLHGDDDQVAPVEASKYLRSTIPGSELHIFKGIGHAPMLEAAEEFNSYLRTFLEKYAR